MDGMKSGAAKVNGVRWTAAKIAADFDRPGEELLTEIERNAIWSSVGHDPKRFGVLYSFALDARRERAARGPSKELPGYVARDSFAGFASAHVASAEALDDALNSGPPCLDPMIGGTYYAGACLERARRTYGRRPAAWKVDDMCAACAASHLATMCAAKLRDLARNERDALMPLARSVHQTTPGAAYLMGDPARTRVLAAASKLRWNVVWRERLRREDEAAATAPAPILNAYTGGDAEIRALHNRGALLCSACGANAATERHAKGCRYNRDRCPDCGQFTGHAADCTRD